MEFDLKLQQFVDWKVYNVTPIKNKFGYRVVLIYADGTKNTTAEIRICDKESGEHGQGQDAGRIIFWHICGIYQCKSERLYAVLA